MSAPPVSYVRTGRGQLKDVAGRKALYVRQEKGIHVLNETAFLIYEALAEPARLSEITEALAALTGAEPRALAVDVAETVDWFVEHGLARLAD